MGALDDNRLAEGMKTQFALRRTRIAGGERPIGWKAGFGTKAMLEKLAIDGPLIGFMTDKSIAEPGSTVSIAGWVKPVAEPEIAIHMGSDLGADADEATVRAAIGAIGPAIELADLNPPPEDVEAILSDNIFHRYVVLGNADKARAGADLSGITARVSRNGADFASTTDLETNTGTLVSITRRVADTLAALGETLKAGEVIIAGSIVPPVFLDANDTEVTCTLDPIGSVSIRFG